MGNEIRIGDILKLEDFNPMDVDVTYIQQTIGMIPKSGMIDINQAEQLATVFLRCADYCSDMVAQATRFVGNKDAMKRAAKGTAIETKIAGGTPATTSRETYGNDPNYIKATEKLVEGQAFLNWITQKHDNLLKAHVLCKDLMKVHMSTRNESNWDGAEEPFIPKNNSDNSGFEIDEDNDDASILDNDAFDF